MHSIQAAKQTAAQLTIVITEAAQVCFYHILDTNNQIPWSHCR